jgi:DNA adenine methylase
MSLMTSSPTATGAVPVPVSAPTVDQSACKEKIDRPTKLTPPLKWWGGKHYLADWIISLMPKHLHYVEPFFGGGAVLLRKNPLDERHWWGKESHEQGISEVINDVNLELTNFWCVLQDDEAFAAFQRMAEATPFSQVQWELAEHLQYPELEAWPDVKAAHAFFVRCRESRSGECKDFSPLTKNRTRRKMNGEVSAWLGCIDGLPEVHARLKRVVILCDDALKVIRAQDGPKTLFYLDPPYLPSTRASTGNYKHDMTEEHHLNLLETIRECEGKVMISGYPSELYDRELAGWKRHGFKIDNKAAGGKAKRKMTEVLWLNYDPEAKDS